ncbi:prenyltransferase/squalene oxidase repeat-containing protein [Streptomyces sp. TRM64462]|uniref:prenyltransferase/squalene oxidase repeat-containing protein n=1 Tax=Streptomyces sp. TRM64462 TaxID=2741726 RepID=UPI0020C7ACE3|nr:prenyltransferase/squalene oxidase repeat-containing protein [Streptomyces sp. TRM64462]
MKILNAYGRGRPDLVGEEDREFLLTRLRAGRRDIWEANIGAHLLALLAVHEFAPGGRVVRDGIEAVVAVRNPDGGVPFIPDYAVFFGALGGLALAETGADPLLLARIGEYLLQQQNAGGHWPYTERVTQDDVETAGAVIETLRAIDPVRYRTALDRGGAYLAGMANPDGGFPTYVSGHPSEIVMTANVVNALAPDWDTYSGILNPAVAFLLGAQQPDGTFERSWSLSEAHAIRRVLHALHRVPDGELPRFRQGIDQVRDRAEAYLHQTQNLDGGQTAGDTSDPISTVHSLSALSVLDGPETRERREQGLAHLLSRQRPDGGFTSKPDQVAPRPIPYNFPNMAGIYVLTALGDLRRHGHLPGCPPSAAAPPSSRTAAADEAWPLSPASWGSTLRTGTTTSSSARDPRDACWPTGSARTRPSTSP